MEAINWDVLMDTGPANSTAIEEMNDEVFAPSANYCLNAVGRVDEELTRASLSQKIRE